VHGKVWDIKVVTKEIKRNQQKWNMKSSEKQQKS